MKKNIVKKDKELNELFFPKVFFCLNCWKKRISMNVVFLSMDVIFTLKKIQ